VTGNAWNEADIIGIEKKPILKVKKQKKAAARKKCP
jgi:hypothetical protein